MKDPASIVLSVSLAAEFQAGIVSHMRQKWAAIKVGRANCTE